MTDRITISPHQRHGAPCICGMRIRVADVLEMLAAGIGEDEILADFPDLEREDIRASLAYATTQRAARDRHGVVGRSYASSLRHRGHATAAIVSADRGAYDLQRNPMPHRVFPDQAALAALCRRRQIRRLSLFGSTLKGINRPDSDVDLLVEFEPEARPSLLTMAAIELELSPLLGGQKVDLRTAADLSRYFRDEVVQMAEPQFEAG